MPSLQKRKVTDILDVAGPVAFVQQVFGEYTCVCPWCAKDLDTLKVGEITFGKLYDLLFELQYPHMEVCEGRDLTDMAVEVER